MSTSERIAQTVRGDTRITLGRIGTQYYVWGSDHRDDELLIWERIVCDTLAEAQAEYAARIAPDTLSPGHTNEGS